MILGKYQVVVGNLGTVTDTDCREAAVSNFRDYLSLARSPYGRAAGESVVLMHDGEVVLEKEAREEGDRGGQDS